MSDSFEITDMPLPGLKLIERKPIGDHRGYLERMFCESELQSLMEHRRLVQINHTLTKQRGTVRGLHFQFPPSAEVKVVSCLRGEIFDVAVDLRCGSPTFLRWHAEILSSKNHRTLFIPEGFAHGFQTLTNDCEMLYLHSAAYNPRNEGGLNVNDSRFNIRWPETIVNLSPRDAAHQMLTEEFAGISL